MGMEFFSLTLREEYRLRVFENRVLGTKERGFNTKIKKIT
jgi:hypothetical protein